MVLIYWFMLVYVFLFGAPIHTSSYTDTYAGLHISSDWVKSSIQIPTNVYVYLWFEFVTLNNTIISVRPVPDIHLLLVASSIVAY